MNSSELFKELITSISLALKEKGFSRKGNCFYFQQDSNWGLLDFQKSRDSTKVNTIFTVNLGICSGRLLKFFSPDLVGRKPSIWHCHWRQRIGFLLPEKQDKWWVIQASDPLDPIANELMSILNSFAVPEIGRHLSDDQLSKEWLSGTSPGLGDIERLIHLSALLIDDEKVISEVVSELEAKSAGKPTALMVKLHIQQLKELMKGKNGIMG